MTTITFDTLKYATRLKEGGVPAAQAEAEATALAEVLDVNIRELVTRQDLADMEKRLESRFESLELHLTIKLGAFLVVASGIVIAIMRLPH
jgi:hypothetical protein